MNKTILLVGGAGYIGTVLTKYLLLKGFNVKCFDALIYSQKKCIEPILKNKSYEFILGDIRDESAIKKIISKINYVVILAGLVGDPITAKYPEESEEINLYAIKNLIKKFEGKNIKKVIFISTCSNYGIIDEKSSADENHILNPLSSYAKHKVEIENYIMGLKNQIDYSPTILRFATAFGLSPRMRFDLTVNHFTKEIVNKKLLNIFDQNTWRPYCHVNDFARLIEITINASKEKTHFQIFNAGSDENNFTKKSIIDEIIKIIPSKNFHYEKNDRDKRNYKVNFNKVKKILNFKAKYNLQYGIKEISNAIKSDFFPDQKKNIEELGNFKIKF